jgi:hypothetical protein
MRHVSPDSKMPPTDHYPQGLDNCSNYAQDSDHPINPIHFHNFFACKYGPLKPNRNYEGSSTQLENKHLFSSSILATIWAENRAGRSKAASYIGQCVTDFSQPDHIEPPETMPRTNISSFALRFRYEPDQGNGPIA